MVWPPHLLANGQRPLVVRPRPGQLALVLQQEAQIVQAGRRVGVVWSQRLLPDRQRPLVGGPCPGQVALVLQQPPQIVQA